MDNRLVLMRKFRLFLGQCTKVYMYLFGTVYLVDHFAGSTIVVLGCTRGVGINYTQIMPILILLIAIYFGILEFLYYGLTYCKLVQPLWRR